MSNHDDTPSNQVDTQHVTILMSEAVTTVDFHMPPASPPRAVNGTAVLEIDSDDPEDNPVQDFVIAIVGHQVPYFAQANRPGNDVEAALAVELPGTVVDLGEGIVVGDLAPQDYIRIFSFMPKLFDDH